MSNDYLLVINCNKRVCYRLMAYLLKLKQRKNYEENYISSCFISTILFLVLRTGKHLMFLLKRLKRSLRKLKQPRCNISPHLISEKRLWITKLIRMMGIRRFPSCRHRFLHHLVWSLQDDGSRSGISRREVCRQDRFL